MILRQVAGVGSRIGEHLVLLVKRLRDLQRHPRGEAEALVGFALERGQIVKQRRRLGGRLLLLLDGAGLPSHFALIASAFALSQMRSARASSSPSFLNVGSNQRPR